MELILTCNGTTSNAAFTRVGKARLRNNEKGEWLIAAYIDGLIENQYRYLIEDDKARRSEIELGNAFKSLCPVQDIEPALTGEEIQVVTARDHVYTGFLKDIQPQLTAAYQDIIAGYTAYHKLSLKLFRLTNRKRKHKRRK